MSYIDGNGLNTIWKKIKTLYSPLSHTHSPNDLTSAVPIAKGGTGATTAAAARANLNAAADGHTHSAYTEVFMGQGDVTAPTTDDEIWSSGYTVHDAMSAISQRIREVATNGYTLPAATSTVLGGVKTGSNITNTNGTISLSKQNVVSALGYTPPTAQANELVRSFSTTGANTLYLTGALESANSTTSLFKNSDLRFATNTKTLSCSNLNTSNSITSPALTADVVDCNEIYKEGVRLDTILFDGDESNIGQIELKDTISNFNYLKIYFVTDTGVSFSSEVYCGKDAGPIIAWLTAFDFDEAGVVRYMYKKIVLTEAAIEVESGYELNYLLVNNGRFEFSGKDDGIRIRKVIGS